MTESPDLDRLQHELTAFVSLYAIDAYTGLPARDVARKLVEYVKLIKVCHEEGDGQRFELVLEPDRRTLLPSHLEPLESLEPLLPDTGATAARPRTVHIGQRVIVDTGTVTGRVTSKAQPGPTMSRFASVQPTPADLEEYPNLCACGWSAELHDRREHEPAGRLPDDAPTLPHAVCAKFESQAGAFAVVQASVCATCGASARAHGIMEVGPPTQIAETLTPLED
jgi:hypothetical protein